MIKNKPSILAISASLLALLISPVSAQTFNIQSTGDWGGASANFPASNAIDGNTAWASRWAANRDNSANGSNVNLYIDFGSVQTIDDIGVAWGRGNSRTHNFEVRARSGTSGSWTRIRDRGDSSGDTNAIEVYNVDDFNARQVRIKVFSNSANTDWTNVTEFEAYGTSGPSGGNDDGDDGGDIPNASGTFTFEKRNTAFSFDGSGGAVIGRQLKLWDTNTGNSNQQWDILPVTNTYDLLRKANTNVCLDGGSGGSRRQAVVLQTCDTSDQGQHWELVSQAAGTTRLKKRGVSYSIDCAGGAARSQLCYLWNSSNSNVNQHFTMLSEGDGGDDGDGDGGGDDTGGFGLNPNDDPWENFDLSEWKIDTPAGEDSSSDCDAQTTEPQNWNNFPSRSEPYFFTHTDGGMRFVTDIGGGTTGNNCNSRTRSELREMLRGSNTSIDTSGDDGDYRNNWALGYQPSSHAGNSGQSWGAREGTMSATLIVNEVTTSGSDSSRGRVVIGQIHADEDEPLRLNYKHRAGYAGGCIYAASEERGGSDTTFMLVGNNTSCSEDPGDDGIALGELFSYEIENDGEDIIVTIRRGDRDGSIINSVTIDLNNIDAGYDVSNDWMYFKAGAYSQNSLGDGGSSGDGDIVTFYRLDVSH